MQSLLLMTVLSGAAHAPEQYYVYGPCAYTRVYYLMDTLNSVVVSLRSGSVNEANFLAVGS